MHVVLFQKAEQKVSKANCISKAASKAKFGIQQTVLNAEEIARRKEHPSCLAVYAMQTLYYNFQSNVRFKCGWYLAWTESNHMGLCFLKQRKAFQIRIDNTDFAEYTGFLIRDPGGIKETGIAGWEKVPSFPESREKIKVGSV